MANLVSTVCYAKSFRSKGQKRRREEVTEGLCKSSRRRHFWMLKAVKNFMVLSFLNAYKNFGRLKLWADGWPGPGSRAKDLGLIISSAPFSCVTQHCLTFLNLALCCGPWASNAPEWSSSQRSVSWSLWPRTLCSPWTTHCNSVSRALEKLNWRVSPAPMFVEHCLPGSPTSLQGSGSFGTSVYSILD